VAIGAVAVELAPPGWITRLSAGAFIALGIYLLWSTRRHGAEGEAEESKAAGTAAARGTLSVLAMTSGLIFVAEMGDKSQLSAIALTARTGHPLEVFLGAVLGLTAVTLLGALTGGAIARRVSERWITRGAAAFFTVAGVFVLLGIS
jgi:putative Ca2+/H+ antiporter (TMEM165/GDT1 family)